MDEKIYQYFLSKFRSFENDELLNLANRRDQLADEAMMALSEILKERDISFIEKSQNPRLVETNWFDDRQQSIELWNSRLSKYVQFMFFLNAIALNPAGLVGGFILGAFAFYLGKQYTKKICANSEVSIYRKTYFLKLTGWLLWPMLIVSSMLKIFLVAIILKM